MLQSGNRRLKSLGEQVYDFLVDQLKRRALAPGTYLDLNDIAARLGVSRTPLRDALISLEADDYVEIVPRRGVRVKHMGMEEIRDLYQVIGSLEATALLEAAKTLTVADHQRLLGLTAAYQEQLAFGSYDGCLAVNYEFHDFFLDRCGNPLLSRLVRSQKRRLYDWPRHTELLWDWERRNVQEHESMVRLIMAGNAPEAASVLRNLHWGFQAQEHFIRSFYEGDPARGHK